jgi:hypothetical protein
MSYGIQMFGPAIDSDGSAKLVFSDSIRTSNVQLHASFSLTKGQTSSVFPCPDANNDSKVFIIFLGNPRRVDVINKTSTGFQLKNNNTVNGTQSGFVIAMRIS